MPWVRNRSPGIRAASVEAGIDQLRNEASARRGGVSRFLGVGARRKTHLLHPVRIVDQFPDPVDGVSCRDHDRGVPAKKILPYPPYFSFIYNLQWNHPMPFAGISQLFSKGGLPSQAFVRGFICFTMKAEAPHPVLSGGLSL